MSNTIKTDVNAEVGNILILHMKGKMMLGEAIRQIEKLYHAQPPAQKEEPKVIIPDPKDKQIGEPCFLCDGSGTYGPEQGDACPECHGNGIISSIKIKSQPEEQKEMYSMEEMKEFTRKSVEYIEAKAKLLKDQGDILDEEGELKPEYRNIYDYVTKAYNEAVTELATLKAAETFSREFVCDFVKWTSVNVYFVDGEDWYNGDQLPPITTTDLLNEFLKQKK